jgi:aminoglycoside phosphotransferase family enzyme
VGRTLAFFHNSIKPYRGKKFGGFETILSAAKENFEQIKFCGITITQETFETLVSYTEGFLEKIRINFINANKTDSLRRAWRSHCQHICLEHPPVISIASNSMTHSELLMSFRLSLSFHDIEYVDDLT